jgi:uncharacterized lipoprotein YbaY
VAPVEELLLIVNCPAAPPVVVGLNFTWSVTDWLGLSVTGKAAPESVKPVPLRAAALIVTGAVPDEVSVTGSVALEFTATLPNASEFVLTVSCGLVLAAAPVPLNWTTVVAPVDELLLTVNCPVAAPAVVGLNFTCSVTDWLGLSVTGKAAPESVKPVPLRAAELIVTGAVPDEVSVNGSVVLEFTATLPKDSEVVLTVSCGVVAATPVPPSWILLVAPVVESLAIVSCPDAAPTVLGLNCTCSVTD